MGKQYPDKINTNKWVEYYNEAHQLRMKYEGANGVLSHGMWMIYPPEPGTTEAQIRNRKKQALLKALDEIQLEEEIEQAVEEVKKRRVKEGLGSGPLDKGSGEGIGETTKAPD